MPYKTVDFYNSSGVSIYLPKAATEYPGCSFTLATYRQKFADFCQATEWDRFVEWLNTGTRPPSPPSGPTTPSTPVTLSVGSLAVTEGDAGTMNANVTVTLSAAAAREVSFAYQFTSGTAMAGSDFVAASGTITVRDNDIGAGDFGAPVLRFTLTLASAVKQTATVAYTTLNGTARAGEDYFAARGLVTFWPGETSKFVDVRIVGDTRFESDETVILQLSKPSGVTLGTSVAVGTILNDDAVRFAASTTPATLVAPAGGRAGASGAAPVAVGKVPVGQIAGPARESTLRIVAVAAAGEFWRTSRAEVPARTSPKTAAHLPGLFAGLGGSRRG